MRYYTTQESANILNVSTTTVQELKNRYSIKKIDNDSLSFLKMIVAKIILKYGHCTLTTIDRYLNCGGGRHE